MWRSVICRNQISNPSTSVNTISKNALQIRMAIECLTKSLWKHGSFANRVIWAYGYTWNQFILNSRTHNSIREPPFRSRVWFRKTIVCRLFLYRACRLCFLVIFIRILFLPFISIVLLIRGTKPSTIEWERHLFTFYTFIGYHYDFIQNFVYGLSIIPTFYCFVRKMTVYAQFLPK